MSGLILFFFFQERNPLRKESCQKNMSKTQICSRFLVWEQEDLLNGINRLDLDMRNGRRGGLETSAVCIYSADKHRCTVDALEKICAGLVEVMPRPGL